MLTLPSPPQPARGRPVKEAYYEMRHNSASKAKRTHETAVARLRRPERELPAGRSRLTSEDRVTQDDALDADLDVLRA